jgi:hypothetical protein
MKANHIVPFLRLRIDKGKLAIFDSPDLLVQGSVNERFLRLTHAEYLLTRNILGKKKIKNNSYSRKQKEDHDPGQGRRGVFPLLKYNGQGDDKIENEKPCD